MTTVTEDSATPGMGLLGKLGDAPQNRLHRLLAESDPARFGERLLRVGDGCGRWLMAAHGGPACLLGRGREEELLVDDEDCAARISGGREAAA
jgi:hypothetical protein